ncbi:MAG: Type I transmembrane sorting receptor [Chrysothrix sp. TS-e1954]|nr:MAG: Type I transmembrane sorting receptor [Chrysothrix sp. TS-e1954]
MHFSTQVAWVVAILPLASSAPFPAQEGQVEAYSISQVPVHGGASAKRRNPVKEYARSLAKFNATVPMGVTKAAAAAAVASGSVPNQPEANDQEYLCPVSVGTPAQTLMMDFDTGSSDFWGFSGQLPGSESSGHTLYKNAASSSSKKLAGETWNIQYGDGSGASGDVFSDKVVIGGVTATSQAVEAATSVSATFTQDTDNDGLVGLGFDNINTVTPNKQKTFINNVQSSLASPVFAAYLRHQAAGSYDFGYIDASKHTGTVSYAPVSTTNGFWEFEAGNFYVGNSNEGGFGDAIADTGTSIILVPDEVIDAYYSSVQGAENSEEGVVFPCTATLPSFSVTVGGAKRTTPGTYINYASVGQGYCYGGIQSNMGLPFSILGDVFLKSQYVVFDVGATRLGMAPQA